MTAVNQMQVGQGLVPLRETIQLINRTGAALVKGDIVALNLDFAATAGQAMVGTDPGTIADDATGYVGGAAITPTATNASHILAVLDDAAGCADNALGTFILRGVCQASLANGVAKGEFLYCYTSNTGATVATHSTRTTAGKLFSISRANLDAMAMPVGIVGISWATPGAEAVGTVWFDGYAFAHMVGGGG